MQRFSTFEWESSNTVLIVYIVTYNNAYSIPIYIYIIILCIIYEPAVYLYIRVGIITTRSVHTYIYTIFISRVRVGIGTEIYAFY